MAYKLSREEVSYLLYTSGLEDGVVKGRRRVRRTVNVRETAELPPLVYKHRNFRFVSRQIGASYAPTDFFVSKGFDSSTSSGIIEPIVVLDVEDPDLEAKAFAVDISLIKNCDKKINLDAFTLEKLISVGDSGKPTTFLRQRPQKSETNYKMSGKQQNFVHENKEEERLLREVLKNHEHVVKVARKEFANCTATFPLQRTQLLKMEKALREAQLDCPQATGKEEYPLIIFGSNIDVADAPEQMNALKDLPEFTRPGKRLMSVIKDKLYGINQCPGLRQTPNTNECQTQTEHSLAN
ncbi:unnamed protein product [Caenorhabditis brenneri]